MVVQGWGSFLVREVPLYSKVKARSAPRMALWHIHAVQGYLAHKKQRPPRTLQQDYAQHLTVVLGGGRFLMSEVHL